MNSQGLKPCPFCGSDDLKIQERAVRDNTGLPSKYSYWFVGCRNSDCFIVGPTSDANMEEAVNNWNNRYPS